VTFRCTARGGRTIIDMPLIKFSVGRLSVRTNRCRNRSAQSAIVTDAEIAKSIGLPGPCSVSERFRKAIASSN